ncbi:hypothetical protein ACQJ18_26065 [Priestia megaterium]|uniref:hypothetical protein n=1 Tax=Priestia megaterium TaxID=1404 RepID=UPI003D04B6E3
MIQYLVVEFIRTISHFTLGQGTKEFLLKLPVGFWTLASGLVTAGVAILTLVVTQMMNLKKQERQAKTQNEALTTQLNHQRELAYRQHFLDKRTEILLDFQKKIEECIDLLEYFYSISADDDRIEKLRPKYKDMNVANMIKKNIIKNSYHRDNIVEMANLALEQLSDIEKRTLSLQNAFRLFAIYLDDDERYKVFETVWQIDYLQMLYISSLKKLQQEPLNYYPSALKFIHIGEDIDNSYYTLMKDIDSKIYDVRDIFKKYLYIHKLDD